MGDTEKVVESGEDGGLTGGGAHVIAAFVVVDAVVLETVEEAEAGGSFGAGEVFTDFPVEYCWVAVLEHSCCFGWGCNVSHSIRRVGKKC